MTLILNGLREMIVLLVVLPLLLLLLLGNTGNGSSLFEYELVVKVLVNVVSRDTVNKDNKAIHLRAISAESAAKCQVRSGIIKAKR
jgi:hypothetical protein